MKIVCTVHSVDNPTEVLRKKTILLGNAIDTVALEGMFTRMCSDTSAGQTFMVVYPAGMNMHKK